MISRLRVAIPNKHITEMVLELLADAGWAWDLPGARQLSFVAHAGGESLRIFMIKAHDIPRMVSENVFDVGFVQASVVQEEASPVQVVKDLPVAEGKMVVGVKKMSGFYSPQDLDNKRLVTRNPRLARFFLGKHQIRCSLVTVGGSPEAYLDAQAGDAVLAYWKTGQTFHENDLCVLSEVCTSNLQLIAPGTDLVDKRVASIVGRITDYFAIHPVPERWRVA